jgi:transcriptional regulator with XRE-family HTH domain
VKAARALRYGRRRAGLTQRELAQRTGVPQSTIGRIESGAVDPRVGTLTTLLRACGFDLEVAPLLGQGVDRSQVREHLEATPLERLSQLSQDARVLAQLDAALRVG